MGKWVSVNDSVTAMDAAFQSGDFLKASKIQSDLLTHGAGNISPMERATAGLATGGALLHRRSCIPHLCCRFNGSKLPAYPCCAATSTTKRARVRSTTSVLRWVRRSRRKPKRRSPIRQNRRYRPAAFRRPERPPVRGRHPAHRVTLPMLPARPSRDRARSAG